MRIVGGDLRGRRLNVPEGRNVRPTSDRAREALFNILTQGRLSRNGNPVAGKRVLDGFAGSGALGMEALSRGAAEACFIEKDRQALAILRDNLKALSLEPRSQVVPADALNPPRAARPCDLVLLDPPYGKGLAAPALEALAAAGWLAEEAIITVEAGRKESLELPPRFAVLDERHYGNARLLILRQQAGES